MVSDCCGDGIFNNEAVCCGLLAAAAAAADGVVKVNVKAGEGENEGSVEIATAFEEPFVSVGRDAIVENV